jgi:GMP synthase-like glutamine amidotransferase
VRALSVVNELDAGPGVFADAVHGRGWELETWTPPTEPPPKDAGAHDAVLVFGGAMNVDEEPRHPWLADEKRWLRDALDREVPILAVCLGTQLLAEAAGGAPGRAPEPEIGWHQVEVTAEGRDDPVIGPLAPRFEAFQWHSYEAPLPPGATPLARSPVCLQAYRLDGRAWGIQFHAEVTLTDLGTWIDQYRSDPDAVRIGLDPARLRAETEARIGAWNRLGAGLCERFLDAATRSG